MIFTSRPEPWHTPNNLKHEIRRLTATADEAVHSLDTITDILRSCDGPAFVQLQDMLIKRVQEVIVELSD